MKFSQIFDEYLRSKEFFNNVLFLQNQIKDGVYINSKDYIKKYVNLAFGLNQFFYN